MAKSKSKVVDDEELPEEEADEEEEAVEEENLDDDDAPLRSPKPKLTKTTIAFILLNWLVVPAFLIFAYLDHMARLQYSYRTLINYVAVWGLPLRAEEEFPSASNETRPQIRLSPEQLVASYKKRKNTVPVPGKELFVAVEEPVPLRLRPSDLSEPVLKDIFWDLPDRVATLEDEIERLKARVPADIDSAAKEVVDKLKTDKKSDDEKRGAIRTILEPLAWDVWQVKKLEEKIVSTPADGLDKLLDESVQRRLYYDILAPLNVYRSPDLKRFDTEKLTTITDKREWDKSLEQIKEYLEKRFSALSSDDYQNEFHVGEIWDKEKTSPDAMKRDSIEKRQTIGFLLFDLSQVQVPILDKKLYPKGIERAQTVCGIREFTSASIRYVVTLGTLEESRVEAVVADRQGYLARSKENEPIRTRGNIDVIEHQIDDLVKIAEHIDGAEKRLQDLKAQRDHFQKIYVQRIQQHKDQMEKLLAARKDTEKYVKDLRELQEQLHKALVELSDAASRNFALEAQIRRIELGYLNQGKKGGKK